MRRTRRYLLLLSLVITAGWSCKKWDDHIAVKEPALNENLMEQISKHNNLGRFREYLVKTGLDKTLSASRNYTVWAPVDEALQALPAETVNDTSKLKAFLLNHISGQLCFTGSDAVREPMLNGKRVLFQDKRFDDANITEADIYVKNGVLHIIDKAVPPLPSIWEYLAGSKDTYAQNAYVAALHYVAQDPSLAELDSINPVTGDPVYKPGTGMVEVNTYRTKVYDIANEDSLYTYIILANDAWNAEKDRQRPYFKSNNAAIADSNAAWSTVKDLAIRGRYLPDQLPGQLLSKFNVHVPMDKAAILETHPVSNGVVYVMSAAACAMEEKIPVCIVEGEHPVAFSNIEDKTMAKVFYRQRLNALTGLTFRDIYLNLGSGGANFFVDYTTNDLYTTKYKVYWVALNDKTISGQGDDTYGTDSTLQQILQIGRDSSVLFTPVMNVKMKVPPYEYHEVYLGELTNDSYDWLLSFPAATADGNVYDRTPATCRLRLQAPATTTTGIPYNLTLDYIKLVPVF